MTLLLLLLALLACKYPKSFEHAVSQEEFSSACFDAGARTLSALKSEIIATDAQA